MHAVVSARALSLFLSEINLQTFFEPEKIPSRHFFKKKKTDEYKILKRFNIVNNQGNASQRHSETKMKNKALARI